MEPKTTSETDSLDYENQVEIRLARLERWGFFWRVAALVMMGMSIVLLWIINLLITPKWFGH